MIMSDVQEVHIVFSEDYAGRCIVLDHVFAIREHAENYINNQGAYYSFDNSDGSYFRDKTETYYLITTETIRTVDENGEVEF